MTPKPANAHVVRNPNFRLLVVLDAIDPKGVEMGALEVRANTEEQARILAQSFLRPDCRILSIDRLPWR